MKALELFEYVENNNGSVSISAEFLSGYRHVNINIDYRDISGRGERMSLSDPKNKELQQWALERMASSNPEIRQELDKFRNLEKQQFKDVESEVLEMVGAFKALVNAMILEKFSTLSPSWEELIAKYGNSEEFQANLK